MITLPSGRKIGDPHDIFIIAEVGSNWTNLDDCLSSIRSAKKCGADAVKFQLFDSQALYGKPGVELKGQLPKEWLPELKAEADRANIEFMCSAFSPELLEYVDKYVNIHKIASAEATHVRILQTANRIGKPVMLSTGAKGMDDLQFALKYLDNCETILLYCVASYPARETLLSTMGAMDLAFGRMVGLSDHSLDIYQIPMGAILAGAVAIEKHVSFIDARTPDSPHSLNEMQFANMVNGLRGRIQPRIGYVAEEKDMITKHNRRLVAIKDIAQGAKLIENENFGIFRSLKSDTHAFTPFFVDEINGKTAQKNIAAGDGIGPGDV